ncbi:MAG: DUF885 family protein [Clostridiales bacterium]|nr:DUF885 family protein [Clostridiales bacterium]
MKKYSTRFLALLLVAAMIIPAASCSKLSDVLDLEHRPTDKKERDKDEDEDEDEEEEEEESEETEETDASDGSEVTDPSAEPSESNVSTTVATPTPDPAWGDLEPLTYPDHIATYDEIHPAHAPGDISGQEASDLLDQIEYDSIQYFVGSNYVDAILMFKDPSIYGIDTSEVSWGTVESDSEDETRAFMQEKLDQLYTIDYESLDDQDRIFYDKITYDFEYSLYGMDYTAFSYYESILNPLTGPQNDIFFLLTVIDFDSVEDAENYIELLIDVDRYYDEICTFEEKRAAYGYASSANVYEEIAATFDALVAQEDDCFLYDTFEERLDEIPGLSDADRERLIQEHSDAMHDYVFPEFEECAERMRDLKDYNGTDQGVCFFEGGDAYFAYIFQDQANSSKTIEQSTAELDAYLDYITGVIADAQNSNDYTWIDEYLDHTYSQGGTEDNLNYLSTEVLADFPELPDHDYFLMDVPEVFEDSFSPAAFLGYHLDTYTDNMIITNNSNVDGDFGITCAHEGYPGHMFQSVYHRSVCEHPYMYLFDSSGYTEGWATYVENYSFKYFADESVARDLIMVENEMNVILMARFDIGINYEGWDIDYCAQYYSDLVGFPVTASDIEYMYNLLMSDPCYAVKYGVGFLNTGMTMEYIRQEFPDATDLEIHTAYLDSMPGTFEQIQANMEKILG